MPARRNMGFNITMQKARVSIMASQMRGSRQKLYMRALSGSCSNSSCMAKPVFRWKL